MYRQILAIQYEAGNLMAPEGNCLQYHTASSGTFASFAWDFATYGEAQAATTTGIAPYTQFHLANQHYNVCFRREQGKTAICYTPKILGKRYKPFLCINIAKGTTDPRVEFCLPKKQVLTQILIKFQNSKSFNQTLTLKS